MIRTVRLAVIFLVGRPLRGLSFQLRPVRCGAAASDLQQSGSIGRCCIRTPATAAHNWDRKALRNDAGVRLPATSKGIESAGSKNAEGLPLDKGAVLRYLGATSLQWGLIMAFMTAADRLVLPRMPRRAALAAVVAYFAFMSLKSRVFSPLDNSRPKQDGRVMQRKRPSWMPPPKAFPIIWTTIGLLRTVSSTMVWQATGRTLLSPALAALMLHLSIGDTWNTINNVEQRLGAAVPGVFCVWLSVVAACVLYFRTLPRAGLVLLPSVLWITVANVLVNAIWRLNGKEPLYPVKRVKGTPARGGSGGVRTVGDLTDEEVRGKKVLLRIDANVPMEYGQILDDSHLRAALPTIRNLLDRGARVGLAAHLGRPNGERRPELSLAPVAERLSELLGAQVPLVEDCVGPAVETAVAGLKDGQAVLLENVRFHKAEERDSLEFSQKLAKPFELYVNDAFSTAHRRHASVEGVARHLQPAVAGLLMDRELRVLGRLLSSPERPFAAIVGGLKLSSKADVILALLGKVDKLVVGGGMAFTFLKARGMSVGTSIVEEDQLEVAKLIEARAKEAGVELVLPTDVLIADRFAGNATTQVVPVGSIPDGWMGVDNGPETTRLIKGKLRQCKTLLWLGPMGVFEYDAFARGTTAVAETLADLTANGCFSILYGGDTLAAVEKAGLRQQMSHVSLGGGAALEVLEGKALPGVAVLEDK